MSRRAKTILKYGISTAVALAMVVGYVCSRDDGTKGFWGWSAVEQYMILCDAFTIPAVMFLGIGGLVWASTMGAMDGLSYVVKYALGGLIPGYGRKEKQERYYDYLQRKRANRTTGYGFLLVVGGILGVIALIFLALYYGYYNG